jgi:hypothetical protein
MVIVTVSATGLGQPKVSLTVKKYDDVLFGNAKGFKTVVLLKVSPGLQLKIEASVTPFSCVVAW